MNKIEKEAKILVGDGSVRQALEKYFSFSVAEQLMEWLKDGMEKK